MWGGPVLLCSVFYRDATDSVRGRLCVVVDAGRVARVDFVGFRLSADHEFAVLGLDVGVVGEPTDCVGVLGVF